MNLSIFPSFHLSLSKRGFTLVELIVSIALITVLSGILLGSRRQFADKLNLKNPVVNKFIDYYWAVVDSVVRRENDIKEEEKESPYTSSVSAVAVSARNI